MTEKNNLPARANQTTPENPWPLSLLTHNIRLYVDRMSEMWVEGQVVEYKDRGPTRLTFFTLRDLEEDVSMEVNAFGGVTAKAGEGLDEGARVVARVKPTFWEKQGRLSLRANEVRLQGLGSLLAQIEKLRARLAAEGLFSAERKKPLPFLPGRIGLICGKDAKAKDDVLVNAKARWPTAQFEVREVAVQGVNAVGQVSAAIQELDADPSVDVIVVARGGGSVEDLLPFSEEAMVRAAAASSTPIVSAVGHEGDAPLLDWVADYRASTPTDAARRIVPDLWEQTEMLRSSVDALNGALHRLLAREKERLTVIMSRPSFHSPLANIEAQRGGLERTVLQLDSSLERLLGSEKNLLTRYSATLAALSPQSTLERGYSILRTPSKEIIDDAGTLKSGDLFEAMLARGTFVGNVVGANAKGSFLSDEEKPNVSDTNLV